MRRAIILEFFVMLSEVDCKFVSSRGLLKAADIHSSVPISSSRKLDTNLSFIKPGSTVYVCSSAIKAFQNLLPSLPHPVILITGDGDDDVPTHAIPGVEEFNSLIESKKIIHWYSQNLVIKHPKMTAIPIGLDYHTLAEKSMSWGPRQTPGEQERDLVEIRNKAAPFWDREPAYCYANFQFLMSTRYGCDRADAMNSVPPYLVYYEPEKITRKKTWEKQSRFAFVISPHGNGYDCHRTWEALCLGCIPIVKTSPIDVLFEDLPVMIVKSWDEVTSTNLRETVISFKKKNFNLNRLELNYWVNLIKTCQ